MAKSSTSFKKGYKVAIGEKHFNWKGDKIGYGAVHMWLRSTYGKANKCENPDCVYPRKNDRKELLIAPKRFEYALLRGKKYSRKRENFIMMCASCHRKYDGR